MDPTETSSRKEHALLLELRDELVCYLLQHNAEPEVDIDRTHTHHPSPLWHALSALVCL